MRMSVFCTFDEPTFRNSPVSSTRSSRACVVMGSSATSSRNMVPPSASSKYPLRSDIAPVNEPFSWPNSSESIVPSGIAPQLTAMYFLCLREPKWCMIFGKNSLPLPLSPFTSTDRSIGATRTARPTASSRACELPIIENLLFASVTFGSSARLMISFCFIIVFCGGAGGSPVCFLFYRG